MLNSKNELLASRRILEVKKQPNIVKEEFKVGYYTINTLHSEWLPKTEKITSRLSDLVGIDKVMKTSISSFSSKRG